jgi:GT2 family glycosyltransferase
VSGKHEAPDRLPIAVVVVTWNSAAVLPAMLESLAACDPPPTELVVVDNASADQSRTAVAEFAGADRRFAVRAIANETNVGFAAGANQGIAASTQPYVCLLNPDIRLLPGTLAALCGTLDRSAPDLAAVGGKLLRAHGDDLHPTTVIDSTGIVMTGDGRHFDRGAGETDVGQYDCEEEVFGISGAMVLFRRNVLERSKVDGEIFDEDFFAFREDADLAWRLRGFGYRALYVPSAVAYHRRSVTPERRRSLSPIINRHSVQNRFLLRIHHADTAWWLSFGLASLARDVVVVGACLTFEWSSLPAFPWLARSLRRHLRRRRQILRRRAVPNGLLRAWFQ